MSKFTQSVKDFVNNIINKKLKEGIDGLRHIAIIIPMYKLTHVNDQNVIVAENYSFGKGRGSVHAEDNAIRKLKSNPTKNKKILMFVIRVSKTGQFGMSKPCSHCLWKICNLIPKKGYKLTKLFFSVGKNSMRENVASSNYLEMYPNVDSIKCMQSKVSSFFKQ